LGVVAAPLRACDKPPREADSKPQVDLLGSMLADESVINAIMGSNEFRVYNTYRSLPGWPQGDVYSQPECLAALARRVHFPASIRYCAEICCLTSPSRSENVWKT
jgi:hypothetical protein